MRKTSILITVAMLLLLILPSVVFASYHGEADSSYNNLDGSFYRATIQALDSKWTSSNKSFILHTMWLGTNPNNDWIEVGFVDGNWPTDNSYYNGYYAAQYFLDLYGNPSAYNIVKITGPSKTVGTDHTFQIQRDGTNTWGVYVDYILRQTWTSGTAGQGHWPTIGIESNNLTSYSAQWNERAFQYYAFGSWYNWLSATLSQGGNTRVSWATQPTSIYTSQN